MKWTLLGLSAVLAGCAERGPSAAGAPQSAPPTGTGSAQKMAGAFSPLAAGADFSCFARESGDVLCWGDTAYGQLERYDGAGTPVGGAKSSRPRLVAGVRDAREIVTGSGFACARSGSGQVTCWGKTPDGVRSVEAVPEVGPVPLDIADAVQIAAGGRSFCAVRRGGTVGCWEMTTGGVKVVAISGIDDAVHVAVASAPTGERTHACVVRRNGTVACFGSNDAGQLGDGSTVDSGHPVTVRDLTDAIAVGARRGSTCALRRGGDVVCWGLPFVSVRDAKPGWPSAPGAAPVSRAQTLPAKVDSLAGAARLAIGEAAACAIGVDGAVKCIGAPLVADGARILTSTTHVAIGAAHGCARDTRGVVRCWGNGREGATGVEPRDVVWPAAIVEHREPAVDVAATRGGTCALRADGQIFCWGAITAAASTPESFHGFGRGGLEDEQGGVPSFFDRDTSRPVASERFDDAMAIATASGGSCIVRKSGDIACTATARASAWGNWGNPVAMPTPAVTSRIKGATRIVAASLRPGADVYCAVLGTGGVTCFSADGWSRRFPDAVDVTLEPMQSDDPCIVHRSGAVDCWTVADFEDPSVAGQRVTAATDFVRVSGGGWTVCGVRRAGTIACWAAGGGGGAEATAPAVTDATDVAVFDRGVCALAKGGGVTCRNARAIPGRAAAPSSDYVVALPEAAKRIVTGGDHVCALLGSGKIACWGENDNGQCGVTGHVQTAPTVVAGL